MRYRLVTALALAASAYGTQAQTEIWDSIEECFEGSRGAIDTISECIHFDWSRSLQDVQRRCAAEKQSESQSCDQRVKRCEDKQSGARAGFDDEMSRLKRSCAAQVESAVARERALRASGRATEVSAAVSKALAAERSKVRREREAERAQARKALSEFFAKLRDSSKQGGLEIVGWRWDAVAGLLVIKRKGRVAVVLPLTSLERVSLSKDDTQINFFCRKDDRCVVTMDDQLKHLDSIGLSISASGAKALLKSAREAVEIFSD